MTVNLSALAGAGQQFFDNNGIPLSGGKLWSYQAGTTTPQTTYTTATGNVAHTNPIILDSAGRVATGEIWLTAGANYKFVLMTSTNTTLATWDNITGINGTGIATNASNVAYDPAGTGAVSTTVQAKLRESVSVKDFGAVGDGVADDTAAFAAAILQSKQVYVPNGTYKLSSVVFNTAGRSGVNFFGQSIIGTVLKPTSAATNFFSVLGGYNQYNVFSNFTIDMVNMPNTSASRGLYFTRTWGNSVRNVNIINAGGNTRPLYLDVGTYTSVFDNCDFGSVTNTIQIQGISLSDAVTTITFLGCSFAGAVIDQAVSISFFQPIVQGSLDKFTISNVNGVSILNGDIEGTGTYLTIVGSVCYGVASANNALTGFSGTYLSGTLVSGYLMDHYGSTPFTFAPVSNMTLYGTALETSSAAAQTRKVIRNTNATGYGVDIQFQNANGSTFVGQTAVGDSVIDARGTSKAVIQQSGTDRLGVDTSNRLIIGTVAATSATAGTNGAPPAQVSGYLRFVNSAGVEIGKIPYYNT